MRKRSDQARVHTVEGSPFHIGRLLRWVMIIVWLVFPGAREPRTPTVAA